MIRFLAKWGDAVLDFLCAPPSMGLAGYLSCAKRGSYERGQRAKLGGEPRDANPYAGGPSHMMWGDGWKRQRPCPRIHR